MPREGQPIGGVPGAISANVDKILSMAAGLPSRTIDSLKPGFQRAASVFHRIANASVPDSPIRKSEHGRARKHADTVNEVHYTD